MMKARTKNQRTSLTMYVRHSALDVRELTFQQQASIEEEGEKPEEEENKESINKNEEKDEADDAEQRPLGVKVLIMHSLCCVRKS